VAARRQEADCRLRVDLAASTLSAASHRDFAAERTRRFILGGGFVNQFLQVADWPNVWAIGGSCVCAGGNKSRQVSPPTAQYAMRQGKVVAENIAAALFNRPLKSFSFKTIGLLASIGRRTSVARVFGFNFSGFFAWWMWRTIYLSKLPGLDKKVRVAFDWTLDLLFSKDVCVSTRSSPRFPSAGSSSERGEA
jgi:NADH dehydrogenase FAD-containing subunit